MAYYNPGIGTPSEATYETALFGANHSVGLADTGADVGGNDVIYQEAAKLGIPVANPYPAFAAGLALMSGDGIHPSDAGHAAIAEAFCEVSAAGACGGAVPPPHQPPPAPDRTAPQTTFAKRPPNHGTGHRATYRIAASEPALYVECPSIGRAGGAARRASASPTSIRAVTCSGRGRPTPPTTRTQPRRSTGSSSAKRRPRTGAVLGSGREAPARPRRDRAAGALPGLRRGRAHGRAAGVAGDRRGRLRAPVEPRRARRRAALDGRPPPQRLRARAEGRPVSAQQLARPVPAGADAGVRARDRPGPPAGDRVGAEPEPGAAAAPDPRAAAGAAEQGTCASRARPKSRS